MSSNNDFASFFTSARIVEGKMVNTIHFADFHQTMIMEGVGICPTYGYWMADCAELAGEINSSEGFDLLPMWAQKEVVRYLDVQMLHFDIVGVSRGELSFSGEVAWDENGAFLAPETLAKLEEKLGRKVQVNWIFGREIQVRVK